MPTLFTRLVRAALLALALVVIGTAIVLSRDWLKALSVPLLFAGNGTTVLLVTILAIYLALLVAAAFGVVVLGWLVWRSQRNGRPSSGSRLGLTRARWLLLSASIVCGLMMAEAAAAAWLSWTHRLPAWPRPSAASRQMGNEVLIVVIGESSALGVPYDDWLSLGPIVGRELQKAIPAHRFRVEVMAEKGATLEMMHLKLAKLTRQPDALIIYSGHNEFLGRFPVENRVSFYVDEPSLRRSRAWIMRAARISSLYTLVLETVKKRRLSVIPARSLGTVENVIGRPVCTVEEARAVIADFHRRLEAIVSACTRIGCLPVLIIPPGNDACDPNQS